MTQYKGIDVSVHNGTINWNKVKADGIDFVIIRAGYGRLASQKDKQFENNYNGAKAAGLKIGTYWYSYAKSEAEARTEANVFLQIVKGKQFDFPLFLDLEDDTQKSKTIANAVCRGFLPTIEAAGYYVGLYSYTSFFNSYIDKEYQNKYDIWVADLRSTAQYSGHKMWQYSFTSKVNGIVGNVDADISYVDYPVIIKTAGKNGYTAEANVQPTQSNTQVQEGTNLPNIEGELISGTAIVLKNTPIYVSSTSVAPANTKTGTFYIWDDNKIKGRYRITDSPDKVGISVTNNVVGWVNESDITRTETTPTPVNTKDVMYAAAMVFEAMGKANFDFKYSQSKTYDLTCRDGKVVKNVRADCSGLMSAVFMYMGYKTSNGYCYNSRGLVDSGVRDADGTKSADWVVKKFDANDRQPGDILINYGVHTDMYCYVTPAGKYAGFNAGSGAGLKQSYELAKYYLDNGFLPAKDFGYGTHTINDSAADYTLRYIGGSGTTTTTPTEEIVDAPPVAPEVPTITAPTTAPVEEKPAITVNVVTGKKVKLTSAPLYISSSTTKVSSKKTGTYYIYNGQIVNGRVRITNAYSRVNKTPAASNVTGWVNVSDLQNA